MEIGKTLEAKTRAEWRRWLSKHHKTEPEIWLVFHTKASGEKFVPYDEAVEEALCYGWIDSIVKKLGETSRAQRFTPRRPGRAVSELNKERMREMIAAGKMTTAGLDAAGDITPEKFVISPAVLRALKKDAEVWRNFQAFPEHYKRVRIGWIQNTSGDASVKAQRLRYFIKMTKANKKFGTIQ